MFISKDWFLSLFNINVKQTVHRPNIVQGRALITKDKHDIQIGKL